MHVLGNVIELDQIRITHGPEVDGFLKVREVAEIEVQPDQAGDVIRMVAPLEDRLACRFDVRRLMVQRQT
ncbi:hypothetical protein D3C84_600680 [compost metagenome]